MLDPQDADRLAEAARRIREDDEQGGGPIASLTDACMPGLRYRLKTVPVCGTCHCIYSVIHTVVDLIRRQRRNVWAEGELRRRRDKGERRREQEKEEMITWLMEHQSSRHVSSCAPVPPGLGQRTRGHRSLTMEPDIAQWLHHAVALEASASTSALELGHGGVGEDGDGAGHSRRDAKLGAGRRPLSASSSRSCSVGSLPRGATAS